MHFGASSTSLKKIWQGQVYFWLRVVHKLHKGGSPTYAICTNMVPTYPIYISVGPYYKIFWHFANKQGEFALAENNAHVGRK